MRTHVPSARTPAVHTVSPYLRESVGYVLTVMRTRSFGILPHITGAQPPSPYPNAGPVRLPHNGDGKDKGQAQNTSEQRGAPQSPNREFAPRQRSYSVAYAGHNRQTRLCSPRGF